MRLVDLKKSHQIQFLTPNTIYICANELQSTKRERESLGERERERERDRQRGREREKKKKKKKKN